MLLISDTFAYIKTIIGDDKNAEVEFSSEVDDKIISDLINSAGFTVTTIENA